MAFLIALTMLGFQLPHAPRARLSRCSSCRCSMSTLWSEYNCGTWVGTAVVVNPVTAEPQLPYQRTRITVSKPTDNGAVQIRTIFQPLSEAEEEQQVVEDVCLQDINIDVDIDGVITIARP